jgi:mycothiol S-conjugate amidase
VTPPADLHGAPLALLSVHAHPDDEASKGAATVAYYAAQGVRSVLVCCTGGEEGDILNPRVDTPEVRASLSQIRAAELQASADAIGYDALYLLGYRDSGMAGSDANAHPDSFAAAPLDEAVERLVRIIRAERPQVIISYPDEQQWYAHPDHLRVHEITGPAFAAAGDPARFPAAGPPWQPSKLYWSGFSFRRIVALHEAYLRRGEESPYTERIAQFPAEPQQVPPTTLVDVGDFLHVRRAALLAHRTQIDPDSHWMRVPDDLLREVFPWDEYVLAESLVATGVPEGEPETDLFAGLREPAGTPRGARE